MRATVLVLLLLAGVAGWAYRPVFHDAAGAGRSYQGEITFTDLQAMAKVLGGIARLRKPTASGPTKVTTTWQRTEAVTAVKDGAATLTWTDTATDPSGTHTETQEIVRTALGHLATWAPDAEKLAKAGNDPKPAGQRAYQRLVDYLDGMGTSVIFPDKELKEGDTWHWAVQQTLPAKLVGGRREQTFDAKLVSVKTEHGHTYLQIDNKSSANLTPPAETKDDTTITRTTSIDYHIAILFCLDTGEVVKTLFHNEITVQIDTKEGDAATKTKSYVYYQDGNLALVPGK